MPTPSELMDKLVADTPDWRGAMFARLRRIILDADPQITEEWKWVTANRPGTPVWEHAGSVCHINVLKDKVKLTLHQGASLPDPRKLFNNGFGGNQLRAMDLSEGDTFDDAAVKALIRAGVDYNLGKAVAASRAKAAGKTAPKGTSRPKAAPKPKTARKPKAAPRSKRK